MPAARRRQSSVRRAKNDYLITDFGGPAWELDPITDEAGRLGPPRGDDGLGRVISSGLGRHDASVVSPVQSPASGPVEIWRRVEITVTSGQYFACSSANSC